MTTASADRSEAGRFRPPDAFDTYTLTVLAWRRTALRIALIAVASAQLLVFVYGPMAYTVAVVGVVVGLTLHVSVSRRYAVAARRLRRQRDAREPSHEHRPTTVRSTESSDVGLGGAQFRVAVLASFAGAVAVAVLIWMVVEAFA